VPSVSSLPLDLVERVDGRIADVLLTEADRWGALDPVLREPLESLRRLVLAGGKRLRPAFCFWAFVGLGGQPDDDKVIDAGAALELLHTCAVIHDDIIDSSPRRHGVESLHEEFARRHDEAGWGGEGRRFGEGAAILVGDLAFVYADVLLTASSAGVRQLFDQLRVEVNLGQYLDVVSTARKDVSLNVAQRIARYKSAKYTVERPLHLGAALAGPEDLAEVLVALSEYGLPLGEAFQLKDDILGVFGDADVTGKPVGDDLREGKLTVLYALARQSAVGPAARLLTDRFGSPDLSPDEVLALQTVFEDTGARAEVEARIEKLVETSRRLALTLPLNAEARRALGDLAGFVGARRY
jgi:geranylgeranyl diphosphate synthase type I